MVNLGVFDRDVDFDFGTAEALITAFRNAASKLDGQAGPRAGFVASAKADFEGHFSRLFSDNARVAAADRRELADRLRETADGARQLNDQAKAENERRRLAREWKQRKDERDANVFLNAWDAVFGEEDPPVGPPSAPVSVQAAAPQTGVRQTPPPGSGGGGGTGVSAARPADLRSFANGSAGLNSELSGTPRSLRSHLDDFAARCTYGRLSAGAWCAATTAGWRPTNRTSPGRVPSPARLPPPAARARCSGCPTPPCRLPWTPRASAPAART